MISRNRRLCMIVFATACQIVNTVLAQVPAEILEFNPKLQDLGSQVAAQWPHIDLSKVEGGPLIGTASYGIDAADFDNNGDMDIVLVFQSDGNKATGPEKTLGMI